MSTWFDQSVNVRDRMELLTRNGLQGLVLVFLVLAIFWISDWLLGCHGDTDGGTWCCDCLAVQRAYPQHAFLCLPSSWRWELVVDDAIVIGENIFRPSTTTC